jgi:hypothetical protein
LLLSAIAPGMAAPRVEVDGRPLSFSAKPVQRDGTILVPVRDLCRALGARVHWDASTQAVTVTRGSRSVRLTIGAANAQVNRRTVAMKVPAMRHRGATMVPMAFVAMGLGAGVRWSSATRTASILTSSMPPGTVGTGSPSLDAVRGASATPGDTPRQRLVGDYSAELRRGAHVDSALLVKRLQDLGANTYMWLIYHGASDWEDLQSFLPMARGAGISVWAYLVPHSETPIEGPKFKYSEPFRVDYVRWAEEIARLSLAHDNLVGYVIDDFWANVTPDRFSPKYISEMVAAGKAINPKLLFYPLMYYPEIGPKFLATVAPLVDGVVAAYPTSTDEMVRALAFLNDAYRVPTGVAVTFPPRTPSRAGDGGFVTQECIVTDAEHATVAFHYTDDCAGPTAGYHVMQLRVDGNVVWAEDTAGRDDGEASVDLSQALAGKQAARLSLGVWDAKGVGNFPVTATFSDLRTSGIRLAEADLSLSEAWPQTRVGAFSVQRDAAYAGQGRFHLPLIAMIAGQRAQFRLRHPEAATAPSIARRVAEAVDLLKEGRLEGVVTYCLDKSPGSPDLDAVRDVFATLGDTPRQPSGP